MTFSVTGPLCCAPAAPLVETVLGATSEVPVLFTQDALAKIAAGDADPATAAAEGDASTAAAPAL